MVLDEEALEAMLARGRAAEAGAPPPKMVVADESDDFEVYERKEERPEAAPGVHQEPAPAQPAPAAPAHVEDFEVYGEEPPAAPPAPPAAPPAAPPTQAPPQEPPAVPTQPEPAKTVEAPAQETLPPAPAPAAPAQPQAPAPPQATAPARRRPEVWPPIRRSHAPQPESRPAPAAAAPTPSSQPRLAILQAHFNHEITDAMADLAAATAKEAGAQVTRRVTVPGVYDMPLIAKQLLARDDVDALVVIGVVVQGETNHDTVITTATAQSLQTVSLAAGKPIGFGVTGPGMTWEQAQARIGNAAHAVEAALALLQQRV